ncbi:MAG: alpha/beta hydrolase [Alphaproteobacteria bacterium]|nr:alpha/beta hydrolase [Alphaproteobacteria bacterium]
MPMMTVRGANLAYELVGERGPWIALSPGGRRGMEAVASLASRLAAAGYRVLIHDRRNCGASDVVIEGEESEYEIWADDLDALLGRLNASPAIVGGSSSGCRLSILMTLRHPDAVRALLLWRVTGGRFAAERLAENYYGQYIKAARAGGMAAVCASEHFAERIAARPENRARLTAMDPERFIRVMQHWSTFFLAGADLPVIGASARDLGAIRVPTIVVPGNDKTHSIETGRHAHSLIPGARLFELFTTTVDVDLFPLEEWDKREDALARAFVDFLKTALAAPARA